MTQILEILVGLWFDIVIFGGLFIYIPFSVISGWVIPKSLEEKYSNPNFGTNGLGRLLGMYVRTGFAGVMFAKAVAFPKWYGRDSELENLRKESPMPYKIFGIAFGTCAIIYEYSLVLGVVSTLGYVYLIEPYLLPLIQGS